MSDTTIYITALVLSLIAIAIQAWTNGSQRQRITRLQTDVARLTRIIEEDSDNNLKRSQARQDFLEDRRHTRIDQVRQAEHDLRKDWLKFEADIDEAQKENDHERRKDWLVTVFASREEGADADLARWIEREVMLAILNDEVTIEVEEGEEDPETSDSVLTSNERIEEIIRRAERRRDGGGEDAADSARSEDESAESAESAESVADYREPDAAE